MPCSRKRVLKQEFQRQLDLPCRLCGLDFIKGWRTDVAVGLPEIGVIQDVEEFCPELKLVRLHDVNILEHRKIPIGISGPFSYVAASCAELLYGRIRVLRDRLKRTSIEPCVRRMR